MEASGSPRAGNRPPHQIFTGTLVSYTVGPGEDEGKDLVKVVLWQLGVHKCITEVAWPQKGYDEPEICGNSCACFVKDLTNFTSGNATRVVFAVEEEYFFQVFVFLGLFDFFKFSSRFQK